ncbi:hypothetical protein OIU34_32935 [Pararhizobium sp. BT-229]|uniref:hypothetical protein n=1 Tax=Pararhizobium sp. BT-229 TaxID=2986923 RepID=UPI0021F72B42|nr:hypothetical protein [Pararhizobium sp. BT-229]MCV9966685.1 hypothetical protein [Pararhizobium sp. BT-229]
MAAIWTRGDIEKGYPACQCSSVSSAEQSSKLHILAVSVKRIRGMRGRDRGITPDQLTEESEIQDIDVWGQAVLTIALSAIILNEAEGLE